MLIGECDDNFVPIIHETRKYSTYVGAISHTRHKNVPLIPEITRRVLRPVMSARRIPARATLMNCSPRSRYQRGIMGPIRFRDS